jgi:hypothetical protein
MAHEFTTEDDAVAAALFEKIHPHIPRLYGEKVALTKAHGWPALVMDLPVAWDERGDFPKRAGTCLGVPAVYGDVEEPRVRLVPSPTEIVIERAELLEERLSQRSAALGRVAAENERLRAALMRVIERADVERDLGLVRAEDIHDAIGYELIQELHGPKVLWRDATPATLEMYAEALQGYVRAGMLTGDEREHRLAGAMGVRRATVSEILAQHVDRMTVPTAEIPAAFTRQERECITRSDD